MTLDQGAPVLTRHSERLYKWIADPDITVPTHALVLSGVANPRYASPSNLVASVSPFEQIRKDLLTIR